VHETPTQKKKKIGVEKFWEKRSGLLVSGTSVSTKEGRGGGQWNGGVPKERERTP